MPEVEKAAGGKAGTRKPKSALLRAHLDSSDEDSGSPQERPKVTPRKAAQSKQAENNDKVRDKGDADQSHSGHAGEKAGYATTGANEAGADQAVEKAEDVKAKQSSQKPAGFPQPGSSQSSPPGKKLSLRERMAQRGISAKK